VSWLWLLPAGAVVSACVVTTVALQRLAAEAAALRRSLRALGTLGVAVDQLVRRTAQVERDLRDRPRR
jgi:hypothetical protein